MAVTYSSDDLRPPGFAQTVVLLAVAFAVYHVGSYVYNLTLHPLASIPGPRLAAASSLWSRRKEWQLRKAHAMLDAHRQYGPVVRTQPNELSFADPRVLATIYPPSGKGFIKADFYVRRKMYQLDHMFSIRDAGQHAARRKLAAKTFSAQSLQQFEPIMNEKVGLLMNQWAARSRSGPIDVFPWLHWLGFEAMMALAFDQDGQMIAKGEPHWVIRSLAAWKVAFIYRETFGHWLNRYGIYVPGRVGDCFRQLAAWKKYATETVQQARHDGRDTVYLSKMLNEPDSYTGKVLTDSQLAEEGMGLMFGGSGTTANSLITLLWAVLSHPDVQERVQDEVRAVEAPADGGILPYSVTSRLTYLNAVLKETLRRYPAIIGSQPRVATQDCEVGGVHVPAGTTVLVTNWTMHHSEEHYPDADAFKPERWLTTEHKVDPNDAFNAFGTGPRACIGRNLAMLELSQTAAAFFRRFDARLDPSMTADLFIQNDTFNAQPQGATLVLHLTDRHAS